MSYRVAVCDGGNREHAAMEIEYDEGYCDGSRMIPVTLCGRWANVTMFTFIWDAKSGLACRLCIKKWKKLYGK